MFGNVHAGLSIIPGISVPNAENPSPNYGTVPLVEQKVTKENFVPSVARQNLNFGIVHIAALKEITVNIVPNVEKQKKKPKHGIAVAEIQE